MPRQTAHDARWQAVIADFRRSGLMQPEVCRRCGQPLRTFRRRLYAHPAATPAPAAAELTPSTEASPVVAPFVPVTLIPDPFVATPDPFVLILLRGRRLAVATGFDAETFRRLDALEDGP